MSSLTRLDVVCRFPQRTARRVADPSSLVWGRLRRPCCSLPCSFSSHSSAAATTPRVGVFRQRLCGWIVALVAVLGTRERLRRLELVQLAGLSLLGVLALVSAAWAAGGLGSALPQTQLLALYVAMAGAALMLFQRATPLVAAVWASLVAVSILALGTRLFPSARACRRVGRQPLVPAAGLLEQPRPLGCDGPGARARPCRPFSLTGATSGSCGQLRALRGHAVFHVLARGLDGARSRPAGGVRRRPRATRTRRLGHAGPAVAGRRHLARLAFSRAHDRYARAGAGASRRQIPRSRPRRPVRWRGSHRVGSGAVAAAVAPDP